MHGLINRSLESFLCVTYGQDLWDSVIAELDPGFDSFEPMFHYEDDLTQAVVDAAARRLDKPSDALLEDFGIYLVTDQRAERVRRLLRFGGVDYEDFLHSLDDLHGRARLAVPDLTLPDLELHVRGSGEFALTCRFDHPGFGHVVMGALRALADDYGALALLEHLGRSGSDETISIRLLETQFSEGRAFDLAAKAG